MVCAAWLPESRDTWGITEAARASATARITRARYGAGCWGISHWRTCWCTNSAPLHCACWSRWEERFMPAGSVRSARSSIAMRRLLRAGALRKRGPWAKCCGHGERLSGRREPSAPRGILPFVEFDQDLASAGNTYQEEIDARAIGTPAGGRVDGRKLKGFP